MYETGVVLRARAGIHALPERIRTYESVRLSKAADWSARFEELSIFMVRFCAKSKMHQITAEISFSVAIV